MGALPSDLVDPSEAFAPSAAPPKLPSDLVDPSQASFGGSSPPSGDSDSSAGAFGYGVVKGVPGGARIASTGVPIAQRVGDALNWLKGGPNEDQKKAIAGLPQSYDDASTALASKGEAAAAEHPWLNAAGTALPQILLPGGGSVKGAMTYGAALGAGEGESPGDSIVRGGLGAMGGALGAGLGKAITPVAGFARDAVLGAAGRLGVEMPRYSVGLPITQQFGKIMQRVPGATAPLEEATHESIAGLGTAAERAAGSATKESAGAATSAGLKDWIGPVSKGEVNARYTAVANQINPNVQTPLSATSTIANDIAARRQAAALSGNGGAVDHVIDALTRPGGLTYNGIKDLRTSVGEKLDSSVLPADMSKAELKQIYGGLSQDLESSASNAGGQQGLQLHQAATSFANQTAQRREQLVKLLGGQQAGASDEAVFGAIKRAAGSTDAADIALLRQAKNSVPAQGWDELSRGMVSTLGRDTDGNFSPLRFVTDYGKISPAAKDELFAQNTPLRQNLDDLATVSRQWKSLGQYANPSGTAGHLAGIEMLREARYHPVETLATFLGAKGMGNFLASPAGAGTAANWVRAMGSGNATAIQNMARKVSAVAGAQIGARVDPMALAAMALQRYLPDHEGGGGDSGGGQPQ